MIENKRAEDNSKKAIFATTLTVLKFNTEASETTRSDNLSFLALQKLI